MIHQHLRRQIKQTLLDVFRRAIPEITHEAEILTTKNDTVTFPDGETVNLLEYDMPETTAGFHSVFTIGHIVFSSPISQEFVIVKLTDIEGTEAYITQYIEPEKDEL